MIKLKLPDGSVREHEVPLDGLAFAESIAKSLAKKAVAIKIDGQMKDLSTVIDRDAEVEIVTRETPDGVDLLRHDASHVMAEAVQELFPGTQVTIGPVIENGFYYDFARAEPFKAEDLEKIEQRMREIVDRDETITREVWDRDAAVEYFKKIGEIYKAEIIASIPAGEQVSVYRQGNWLDLCRGPHLPSTGKLGKAFKLTKLAGAYWRGDSRNEMLQRIYGTCWANENDLKAYLTMVEEAERRDHRKIGREMDLFHLQEEAQGSVFWHPKGWRIWQALEQYVRRRIDAAGYVEVRTPQLLDSKFWEQSGHWGKYRENMFVVPDEVPSTDEDAPVLSGKAKLMAIKPMNCPAHIQIFKQGVKSYRDLPLRMAEFGCCHRNEPHGALHGLMRVRQMTQDDAHIFCTEDQIKEETEAFVALLESVYEDMGFTGTKLRLATRPDVRAGTDETWDKAEKALEEALKALGKEFDFAPGEGAFYGPKLEFHLRDAIGRSWQLGTLQLDFVLPERLDASYIGEDGNKHRPVMLHRAILGSLERFIGILIENYEGRFPMWLAPVQAVVTTITSDADPYAEEMLQKLRDAGIRAELDLRNEKINYKVREHSVAKVPAIFVAGKREAEEGTVSIRRLGSQQQQTMKLDEAIKALAEEATPPDMR
ncbi:threonyl-tRNA synthetase [Parvibaculum lavamentivorans DS-1]|uniref:Threonine--tRNA ligase n=1 Tax=Parvibaculum lavamentivorans (strain DS-1 / DSM 13023 / NCIMB 13966) TaxID=402881 RepID=SYT_PARL1|nr:threonine--tRNA ligase [Parvibaculum lavamentivorans]A7HWJ3.1 RecName: Full=Threonine--tRNA ligase; AltName: Full=Threonyl-tRNA synthetase; Short=ThrRS [Parvibaculum lavamentivorans DS-1]ABS64276.1 threonyl-tRNA synthetase [Parvibaculum lavamentivorans DS-1]